MLLDHAKAGGTQAGVDAENFHGVGSSYKQVTRLVSHDFAV
jgi:hypothetical protein